MMSKNRPPLERSSTNQKASLGIIFLTVFIDLVGFGIVIPLNPYLAREFGATPFQVGLLMTVYSLMQFVFSPIWGRISDRIGRRPILLMGLLGASFSYVGFAFATSLWMLYASRIFAGIFTANISTAMAYIADITPEKDRSKSLGLIGAAFGLGFVLGPAIGGVLGELGQHWGHSPPFGMSFAAIGAALICFLNFILAVFILKESRPLGIRAPANSVRTGSRLARLLHGFQKPLIGSLMVVFLLSGLGMAHMEVALPLMVKEKFGWSFTKASYMFALVGIVMAFTQGFLIRKLLPRYGEKVLLPVGLVFAAIGLITLGWVSSGFLLGVSMTFLALGVSLANPSTLGSISLLSSSEEQGGTFGETQSLSALGRIIGPATAGYFYEKLGVTSPFMIGGLLFVIGFIITLKVLNHIPNRGKQSTVV